MDRVEFKKRRVLTVREVSNYLRVHPSTVYRLLKKNQLPAFRVGSDWRFNLESLDRWLTQLESTGRAPSGAVSTSTRVDK